MKKKIAMLLVVSMIASMSVTGFAETAEWKTNTEIDGSGDVKNPIIRYQIPANLDFAVDAFQQADDTGSQVYSPDFQLINKSNVAIQVSVNPYIVPKDDTIKVKESTADVNATDTTKTDKEIYLEAVAAKDVATKAADTTAGTAGTAAPATIKTQGTAAPTFTNGDPSLSTSTTFEVDFTGAELDAAGAVAFQIQKADGTVVVDTVYGKAAASGTTPALIAATFGGVTFDYEGVTYTGAVGTSSGLDDMKVTFTGDTTQFSGDAALSGATLKTVLLSEAKGTEGKVALDEADYELYGTDGAASDPQPVNGANTDSKAALKVKPAGADAKVTDNLTFALQAATYLEGYTNGPKNTFSEIGKDATSSKLTGASVFRFMGTVNPAAKWEKDDVKVKAVFDVSGLSKTMYESATKDVTLKGLNVIKASGGGAAVSSEPTVTAPASYSSGPLVLNYDFGGGDNPATAITSVVVDGLPTNLYPGNAVDNTTAKTITISNATVLGKITASGVNFTVTFKLTDNTTKEVKVNVKKA